MRGAFPQFSYGWLLMLAIAPLCETSPQARIYSTSEQVEDAYRIYSASVGLRRGAESKVRVLIQSEAKSPDMQPCARSVLAEYPDFQEAITDYGSRRKAASVLERRFKLEVPYELVSESSRTGDDTRSTFYFAFSVVGFNASGDRAVLYKRYHCGLLCGEGGFYLFIKTNGTWKEQPIDKLPWCRLYF